MLRASGVGASGVYEMRRPLQKRSTGNRLAPSSKIPYFLQFCITAVQGLADARKRARRSGLVQFFAVYQFDRGGILQFLQSTSLSVVESYICLIQFANCCNHAVRGSVVWRLTSDTTCEFTVNSVF